MFRYFLCQRKALDFSPLHLQCLLQLSEKRAYLSRINKRMKYGHFLQFFVVSVIRIKIFTKDGNQKIQSIVITLKVSTKDIASASGRFGASYTLQTRCSPLPFLNMSLIVAAWARTCPPAGFFGSDMNTPPPGSAMTAQLCDFPISL